MPISMPQAPSAAERRAQLSEAHCAAPNSPNLVDFARPIFPRWSGRRIAMKTMTEVNRVRGLQVPARQPDGAMRFAYCALSGLRGLCQLTTCRARGSRTTNLKEISTRISAGLRVSTARSRYRFLQHRIGDQS